MKKSNLIQIVTILLVSVILMLVSTTVNAADDNAVVHDLTGTLTNNTSNNTSNTSNNASNSNSNSNSANNINTNNTNKTNNTNNSSVYNNNNLPKTGIEDSIPVAALVVVFGVSAVYAYRKIKEYRNI